MEDKMTAQLLKRICTILKHENKTFEETRVTFQTKKPIVLNGIDFEEIPEVLTILEVIPRPILHIFVQNWLDRDAPKPQV